MIIEENKYYKEKLCMIVDLWEYEQIRNGSSFLIVKFEDDMVWSVLAKTLEEC